MTIPFRAGVALAAIAQAIVCGGVAAAQTRPSESASQIEDVIITAERRPSTIQRTRFRLSR